MKPQESGGEWVIKTPKLARHCQVPGCTTYRPAKKVNNRWRCDVCRAKTKKGRIP